MEYKKINTQQYILSLTKDELVMKNINDFMATHDIGMAQIAMIGAINNVTLGCVVANTTDYLWKKFRGQWELLSGLGNITWNKATNEPSIHCHISMSNDDFHVVGGHLQEATVALKVELIITILSDDKIYQKVDKNLSFPLWAL